MTEIVTLADVIERIDVLPKFSPEQRRDMKNAVQKIGAHLHDSRNLSLVPARGRQAMNAIEAVTASQLGRSTKTRDNLVSLARIAIESCCAGQKKTTHWEEGRYMSPVGAVWASLLKREKGERGLKLCALRLAKWAEAAEFLPLELPDDAWELFLAWQRETSWSKSWEAGAKQAVWAWNKLVAAGMAGRAVDVKKRQCFMPKITDFPVSFQQDLENYKDYCRHPVEWCLKRKACRHRLEPYAEDTIETQGNTIRWAAALLVASGFPLTEITEISVLGAGDNPTRILEMLEKRELERFFSQRAEGIPSERGEEKPSSAVTVVKTLRTVILNWKRVRLNEDGTNPIVTKFRALMKGAVETKATLADGTELKLRIKSKIGLSMRNVRRLEAADEPTAFHALWTMPERVMRRVEKQRAGKPPTYVQAKKFEVALACAFQRAKPLRGLDLSILRFGVYVAPAGENLCGRFEFMARKNDRQISLKIKDEVLTFYELFLSIYRPKILRGAPDLGFVFAGNKGGPIARANLARRITKLVRQETGLKWHNHLWRHHGMVLLRDHGGSLENGADLLGISLEAARRAYDKDRQAEAGDHLDKAAMAKLDAAKRK
jgi:hypothetical protein